MVARPGVFVVVVVVDSHDKQQFWLLCLHACKYTRVVLEWGRSTMTFVESYISSTSRERFQPLLSCANHFQVPVLPALEEFVGDQGTGTTFGNMRLVGGQVLILRDPNEARLVLQVAPEPL